ncbi:MAG: HIT domain-containing protein [Nanoarchaeota archaeon]|nr:HIT domain-containing protein [Nanoarchaeota archaeon]MCK5629549.1 HIT domain-containing protein [Nanoarchaeota archaeon]
MEMTPEQQAAMQEKIKNMSPEELEEFQKQQCIFCQMIAGKVQVKKIYEDDICFAILDINPANPGHILLMPKEHYPIMPIIPEKEIGYIFIVARELSHALLRALGVEGTNIFVANGAAAGQRAQHFMVHIIPRMDGDNVKLQLPRKDIDEKQMQEIREIVAASMSKATGVKEPVQGGIVHFKAAPAETSAETPVEKESVKKEAPVEKKAEVVEEVPKEKAAEEKKAEEKPNEDRIAEILKKREEEKENEEKDKKKQGRKKPAPTLDMISDLLSSKDKNG